MVTRLKSLDNKKNVKANVLADKKINKVKKSSVNRVGRPRKSPIKDSFFEEASYSKPQGGVKIEHQSSSASHSFSHLMSRSKDLVSGDATSVTTVAAIVLGAALIEVELIPGLVIGAGAVLLGKLFPELGDYVRPAIKGLVRSGFSLTQKLKEVIAETSEQVNDLVAEVVSENKNTSTLKNSRNLDDIDKKESQV